LNIVIYNAITNQKRYQSTWTSDRNKIMWSFFNQNKQINRRRFLFTLAHFTHQ